MCHKFTSAIWRTCKRESPMSVNTGLVGPHGYTGLATLQEQYCLLKRANSFFFLALKDTCNWNQCITLL